MQRIRTVVAGSAAVLAAAACSRSAPAGADDALRADLEAAQAATAIVRPAGRTEFVSALELGRAAEPAAGTVTALRRASAAPARVAPARVATAPRRRSAERVVRPVARVRTPDPAPADEPIDDLADAPVETPSPRVEPAPAPARDEPVVGVPSRRPDVSSPPPRRRGRVWDMGDVIRNAPFPINP